MGGVLLQFNSSQFSMCPSVTFLMILFFNRFLYANLDWILQGKYSQKIKAITIRQEETLLTTHVPMLLIPYCTQH